MRNAIDNRDGETSLADSFDLIENYVTIQRIRYGEKLHTVVELEDSISSVQTPKLIIQPLVENAIMHGLEPKVGTWRLTVKAVAKANYIEITVADNGVGFPEKLHYSTLLTNEPEKHVGLYNIQRRLELRYGKEAGLTIDSLPNEGTIVRLRIPR